MTMNSAAASGSILALACLCWTAALSDPVKRPMRLVELPSLELRVAVEAEPEWLWNVNQSGRRSIAVVESPDNYYPPTVMTYVSFPTMRVPEEDLELVATEAVRQAARNYSVPEDVVSGITPTSASHGAFSGYETIFAGVANDEAVDVRLFVGQDPDTGKGPIAIQAYTLRGKLPHISEQIRRAWGNVRYLQDSEQTPLNDEL